MNIEFKNDQFKGEMVQLDAATIDATSNVTQSGNPFPGFPRVVRDLRDTFEGNAFFQDPVAFVRRRDVGYKLGEDVRFAKDNPHKWVAPANTPLEPGLTEVRTALVVFPGVPAGHYLASAPSDHQINDFGVSMVLRYEMDALLGGIGAHTFICTNFAMRSDNMFTVGARRGMTYAQMIEFIKNWANSSERNLPKIGRAILEMKDAEIPRPMPTLQRFAGRLLCDAVNLDSETGLGIQDVSGFARSMNDNITEETEAVTVWDVLNWGTEQLHPAKIAPNRWLESHSKFTAAVIDEFGNSNMKW